MVRSLVRPEYRGHLDARMGWYIIIGSLPIVVLGVAAQGRHRARLPHLWLIGSRWWWSASILGIADRVGSTDRLVDTMRLRDAILIGIAQASRWCRGLPLRRHHLDGSLPRLRPRGRHPLRLPAGDPGRRRRGVFELKDIPGGDNAYGWGPTLVATVVSFVVGYAAIAWLLRYVTTRSYTPFVLYRMPSAPPARAARRRGDQA